MQVPLTKILSLPHTRGAVEKGYLGAIIDMAPTIMSLAGGIVPDSVDGAYLLPFVPEAGELANLVVPTPPTAWASGRES